MLKRSCVAVLTATVLAACQPEAQRPVLLPTEPELAVLGPLSVPAHQLARPTRAVTIDVPPDLPPWYTSDDALIQAAAEANGRILIGLKAPGSPHALENGGVRRSIPAGALYEGLLALSAFQLEDVSLIGDLGIMGATIAPEVAPALRNNPWVDFVDPNLPMELAGTSTWVAATAPFLQQVPWGVTMVGGPSVWNRGNGSGVEVMIIDTGIDNGHEDLIATSSCLGHIANGGCVDDAPGDGHGTTVLANFLARNNSIGYVGTAPGIAAADVHSWGACDTGGCDPDDVTWGIYKADSLNVDVLNLSLGSTEYIGSIATAVSAAISSGVLVVAAAGNDTGSTPVYPAAHLYVIAVSGVQDDYSFANESPCGTESGHGNYIDVSAPFWTYNAEDGGYGEHCGNSFAAPHVAAVAALIKDAFSTLDNFGIRTRIRGTATDLGATGYDEFLRSRLVSAWRALGPWVDIEGLFDLEDNQQCQWQASVGGGYGTVTKKWYVNGAYQQTGESFTYNVQDDSFWLELRATDGQGITRSKTRWVSVWKYGGSCDE